MKNKMFEKISEALKNESYRKSMLGKLIYLIVLFSAVLLLYNVLFKGIVRDNIIVDDNGGTEIAQEDARAPDVYDEIKVEEEKLQEILSKIKGVGTVDVMITYETGSELVPAFNSQQNSSVREEQGQGGSFVKETNTDSSKDIVSSGGSDGFIVLKEIKPKVKGVIVVAEGAESVVTKNKIIEAVGAVFNIPVNRITVFEKN